MWSSAFFIEAAANTMRDFSCAPAGEWAAPSRMMEAAKIEERRCIVALHACSRAHVARTQIRRWSDDRVRQAEAPFRQPDGLTVDRDIARCGQYQRDGPGKARRGGSASKA